MSGFDEDEGRPRNSYIDGDEYPLMDNINRPTHYQHAGIETIEYIRAVMNDEQLEGYYLGNILKYVSRYRNKGGVEDLEKAMVYLKWLITLRT